MLVDATPTAYMPNLAIIQEQLPKLGRIRMVMSNYSQYSSRYDLLLQGQVHNTFNPEFAGGCLMDLNYYNLYMNILLFGKPRNAVYYPNLWKNGIDTSGVLVMQYADFVSTNTAAKDASGENFFQIEGEKGFIYATTGPAALDEIHVVTKAGEEVFNEQDNPDRWYYEVTDVAQRLLRDDYDTIYSRLDTMLTVIETLENVRKEAGIFFPGD